MVARRAGQAEDGFTYVGLVIFVTILGLVGAATLKVDSLLRRVAAEQELLEIGAEYSEALRSYAAATPRGSPTAPPTMQELLKDPRFPGTRRHLRKIYVDPVTGRQEWGIVWQGDNVGVLAVYSLSQAQPLKLANFDARFQNFENKQHLSEWKFTASGTGASAAPGANGQPPALQPNAPNQPPASLFPTPEAAAPTVPPVAPAPEQDKAQEEPQDESQDNSQDNSQEEEQDAPAKNDAEPPKELDEPPARPEPAEGEPAPPAEPPPNEGRPGGR